jgi:hypothetical protein
MCKFKIHNILKNIDSDHSLIFIEYDERLKQEKFVNVQRPSSDGMIQYGSLFESNIELIKQYISKK